MFSVYTQARSLRDRALFRPWLCRVARNALLQHPRRNRKLASDASACDAAEHLAGNQPDPFYSSCMAESMSWLAPDDRELILLRYIDGLEHHENRRAGESAARRRAVADSPDQEEAGGAVRRRARVSRRGDTQSLSGSGSN